jgi:phospholipid/cholesterol/gamma-HCH transport system substrate-binding protein
MERSLVGDTKIRAYSGILADPPLPDGAERTALRGDASEQIPQVMATMRDLLANLERMSADGSPLNASLDNVRSVTERMKGRYGALGGVLGSDENAKRVFGTLDRANALLEKTDARLNGRGGVMDDSQAAIKQLNDLLRESRDSLKKVDAVLVEAQAIAANAKVATTDLGTLRTEVDASVRKASQLIDEINSKWPFARDTEVKLP